jgi:hypothetical protein
MVRERGERGQGLFENIVFPAQVLQTAWTRGTCVISTPFQMLGPICYRERIRVGNLCPRVGHWQRREGFVEQHNDVSATVRRSTPFLYVFCPL